MRRAQAFQRDADARATLEAYASDYAIFERWCTEHGFLAMPPSPDTVAAFLADAGGKFALATLRRRVAAIAHACGENGYELDTRSGVIRKTLRGVARAYGEPPRRAAALTTYEIRRLCAVCDDTLAGRRDRALLLVGFAGALRRSELAAIEVEDISWTPTGFTLLIPRSKTDPEGEGAEIDIVPGDHQDTCPVRALQAWLAAAAIAKGPVFRKVNKYGNVETKRLSNDAVRQILLKRAAMAGLGAGRREHISPHGLRSGFITTSYKNGVLDEVIMGHTRHKSHTTMRSYVRRNKLGAPSPSGSLGL